MKKNTIPLTLLVTLFIVGFSNIAFGQGVQTSGGVDVDGTWYLGEELFQTLIL